MQTCIKFNFMFLQMCFWGGLAHSSQTVGSLLRTNPHAGKAGQKNDPSIMENLIIFIYLQMYFCQFIPCKIYLFLTKK